MTDNQGPEQGSSGVYAQKAKLFHFLAGIYNQRPDHDLAVNLKSFGTQHIQFLVENTEVHPRVAEGFAALSDYIHQIQNQPSMEIKENLAVDWTRLFRGVSPDYGPKPPYESVYRAAGKEDQSQMTEVLSSLMAEYQREMVVINKENRNRPDYIGLELGFVGYLLDQADQAETQGEPEQAEEFAHRAARFISNHLEKWIFRYIKEAEEYVETGFYRGVMLITEGVVREFSVPPNH